MTGPTPAELRKHANAYRFRWHAEAIKDPEIQNSPTAVALVGHIMHRFKAEEGAATFSTSRAAKAIRRCGRSVDRAKALLQKRNWIVRIEGAEGKAKRWGANRYRLAGGPEDLLLEEHKGTDSSDSP